MRMKALSASASAAGRVSARRNTGPSAKPVQLPRPDGGEKTDNGGDRQQDDPPDDPPWAPGRRDLAGEVTVEQSKHQADQAEHAEENGRDQADPGAHVACGQPGQDELRGPDR